MALFFLFVLHNPISAVNATWPWDVVVPEITSEAEELCSKPQEEPKSPRLSTSDPEPMTPKALTGDQVRYDSETFTASTRKSYMFFLFCSMKDIVMCSHKHFVSLNLKCDHSQWFYTSVSLSWCVLPLIFNYSSRQWEAYLYSAPDIIHMFDPDQSLHHIRGM